MMQKLQSSRLNSVVGWIGHKTRTLKHIAENREYIKYFFAMIEEKNFNSLIIYNGIHHLHVSSNYIVEDFNNTKKNQ